MSHIILYAIVPIIVVMLLGFVSGKKGIFDGADSKKFNKVVFSYALPAALFVSIVQADREMLYEDIKVSVVSFVVIMFCFMLVYFLFKKLFKKNTQADAAVAALINGSPTIGALGFAVMEPIFGASPAVGLVVAIVGIVVNAIGIPVGLSLLNDGLEQEHPGSSKVKNKWAPVIQALEQPIAWAPILAVVWVLIGIDWPDWASPSFELMAKANASMAVFSAGVTLSTVKVTIDAQSILGVFLKLILMPALALVFGLMWHMDPTHLQLLVIACALPSAFSGAVIADEYSTYVATGTSSLAISVVLFMVLCPIWMWLAQHMIATMY